MPPKHNIMKNKTAGVFNQYSRRMSTVISAQMIGDVSKIQSDLSRLEEEDKKKSKKNR